MIGALTKMFGRHAFVPATRARPHVHRVPAPSLRNRASALGTRARRAGGARVCGLADRARVRKLPRVRGAAHLRLSRHHLGLPAVPGALAAALDGREPGGRPLEHQRRLGVGRVHRPRSSGRCSSPATSRPAGSAGSTARRFGQWWAMSFCIVVLTILAHLAYIKAIGAVDEFLNQEAKREKGHDQPLRQVLDARRYWIDVTFTPLAVTIGKIAAPIFLFRLGFCSAGRSRSSRWRSFLMATVEYVHSQERRGRAHVLAVACSRPYSGALGRRPRARTAARSRRPCRSRGSTSFPRALSKDAIPARGPRSDRRLYAMLVLPDGVRGLYYARTTGGRLNDRGRRIFQDVYKSEAAGWLGGQMSARSRVQIHASMHTTWAVDWALRRPTVGRGRRTGPPRRTGEDRYFLADLAFMKPPEQVKMARDFHVVAVGQFVLVDRAAPPRRPMATYSTCGSSVLSSGISSRGRSRYERFGPTPGTRGSCATSSGRPRTHCRPSTPRRRRSMICASLTTLRWWWATRRARTTFWSRSWRGSTRRKTRNIPTERSSSACCTRVASRRRSMCSFRQRGRRGADDMQFDIHAVVERAPLASLVEADNKTKAAGMPLRDPPRLWKPGFIYVDHTEIRLSTRTRAILRLLRRRHRCHPAETGRRRARRRASHVTLTAALARARLPCASLPPLAGLSLRSSCSPRVAPPTRASRRSSRPTSRRRSERSRCSGSTRTAR